MDVVLNKVNRGEQIPTVLEQKNLISKYVVNQLILGSILPLGFASMIYILFRSKTLIIFSFFEIMNISEIIELVRIHPIIYSIELPNWFLYALPDGLYAFSFTTLLLLIFKNRITNGSLLWICSIPVMAIVSEFLQNFGWFPGTFDMADLVCYSIGFVLPFLLFKKEIDSRINVSKNNLIAISVIAFLILALVAGDETLFQFQPLF